MPRTSRRLAAKIVAEAQLANINVGTRAEVIAARKAALERAQASVVLAQKTYDRVSQLAEHGNAPLARLDQATDTLHESQRAVDQAKSAYEQAVNGYTKEEHEIAAANVKKAIADIAAVQSIIDQMVVYAPVASQVYQRNVEPGEYVSPGVPLMTLIDLDDMWIHFDLREDLVKTLKVGDRFDVRIPALADRRITVEVKLIATKGEYASWRATRATGDFDLRTFSIRAYPVDKVPELRPGMSAYLDWRTRDEARAEARILLVARREWRWLLHDRVALILIFGVPLFAFAVLTAGVQPSGDPRSRGGRRRCRPLGDLARLRGAGGGLARAQHRRARRRSRVGGARDPLRRRHRAPSTSRPISSAISRPSAARRSSPSITSSSSPPRASHPRA